MAYILETQRLFEDLRQVAAQLAGLLVLSAAGSKSAGPHHPMIGSAGHFYHEAVESLHRARPTERAGAHYRHLLKAAESLGTALAAARTRPALEPILISVKAAYVELQHASRQLPGFEMVAFDQACCGRNA